MQQKETQTPYFLYPNTSNDSTDNARSVLVQRDNTVFDPKDSDHKTKLLQWCSIQWPCTFKKAMSSGNPLVYHDCCTSFSRRHFSKNAGHPPLQSSTVTKMPSFKDVNSSEDLFRWLYKLLADNTKRGRRCLFPSLNRQHIVDLDFNDEDKEEELESLRKRVDSMQKLEEQLANRVKTLTDENEKLLKSAKTWYCRFQELQEEQDKSYISLFSTPFKRKPKSNFDAFEDLF